MTIDLGDTPTEATALLVRGLARVDIVDGGPDEYAIDEAWGADQVTEFERQVRSMYDQMARISIEPESALRRPEAAHREHETRSGRAQVFRRHTQALAGATCDHRRRPASRRVPPAGGGDHGVPG